MDSRFSRNLRGKRFRRGTARRALLAVHRWLGLTAGVIFAIAAGTGAILVYADELDALIGGPRFETTPGLVGPEAIDAAIRRHAPGGRPIRVTWPGGPVNVLGVRVADQDGRQRDLVLDAGTGGLLDPRRQHLLLVGIRRLHVGLLMGPAGSRIVLLASCASIVSLGIGLVLWWPGIRRLGRVVRLRLRGGTHALNLDLHQTLGALAAPLLLVMTVTGVLMDPSAFAAVSRLLDGGPSASAWDALRSSPGAGPGVPDIDLATAFRNARAGAEAAPVAQVSFPAAPDGVVDVRLGPDAGESFGAVRVALDRHTGAVLLRQDLRYDPRANGRLHFGLIGAPAVRALYAVACLVGFSLLPTGLTLWWMKRRRRLERAPLAA